MKQNQFGLIINFCDTDLHFVFVHKFICKFLHSYDRLTAAFSEGKERTKGELLCDVSPSLWIEMHCSNYAVNDFSASWQLKSIKQPDIKACMKEASNCFFNLWNSDFLYIYTPYPPHPQREITWIVFTCEPGLLMFSRSNAYSEITMHYWFLLPQCQASP